MALKTKRGYVTGTLDALSMGVTVWDPSPGAGIIGYDEALAAANLAIPAVIVIDVATSLTPGKEPGDVNLKECTKNIFKFEFTYRPTEAIDKLPPVPVKTGDTVRRADTVAGPVKRSTFLESVGVYRDATGTNNAAAYPYVKLKVMGAAAGGHYVALGERVFEPVAETHHREWYPANALVTEVLLNKIEALVGSFNDAIFLGKPVGSLQLVRFNANERNRDDWEFSYAFGYRAPRDNFYVDTDIKIPKIRACDHYWTEDGMHFDTGSGILQPRAKFAVVGRWGDLADFTQLGIPGTP